jgi:hypothetical protein
VPPRSKFGTRGDGEFEEVYGGIGGMQCARDALLARWVNRGRTLFVKVRELVSDIEIRRA